MIDPGFLLSYGAKVKPRIPCADSRGVSLLTAFPAAPAAVWFPAVRRYVAPVQLLFPVHPAGNPPDLDSSRLKQF